MRFLRGTAITTTAILSDTPSTIKISVFDKDETKKVDQQTMSLDEGYTYKYTYQTLNDWEVGIYYVIVEATIDSYITRKESTFTLVDAHDGL